MRDYPDHYFDADAVEAVQDELARLEQQHNNELIRRNYEQQCVRETEQRTDTSTD